MERIEKIKNLNYYLIVIAIYISIFINSYVFFKDPFEFYVGYLIYVLLLPVFIMRHKVNTKLVFIFSILFVTGLFNIFLGNNTPQLFFKVFTGLVLSYFFYYYIIVEFEFDIELLFKWYLKGCYLAALIGIFQFISFQIGFEPGYNYRWIFNKWGFIPGGNFGIRINSIFGEPTYLGALLSASFFVSLNNLIRRETYYLTRFQSLVIIAVYFLSFSGLGQTGIFLSLIFLAVSFGFFRYIIIFIPLGILLFNFLYTNSKDFSERYDSTVNLFLSEGKFELGKTHGSSFILYNNYKVALQNYKNNFVFGSGIGSHPIAFERYSLAKMFKVYGFNLNSADANSMLLRLISETGSFGVAIFLFIMIRYYVRANKEHDTFHWLISNSIIIMIILNLFRQGHYFLNGFPFFVLLYIYNRIDYDKYLEGEGQLPEQNVTDSQLPEKALPEIS